MLCDDEGLVPVIESLLFKDKPRDSFHDIAPERNVKFHVGSIVASDKVCTVHRVTRSNAIQGIG